LLLLAGRPYVVEDVSVVAATGRGYSVRGRMSLAGLGGARNGREKLGQPVWLSYFIAEVKSGSPHPAHAKIPGRVSPFSGLVPAASVPSSRNT
jgi:hypothetical protein